jgi:myo-inositol-1(or 4)-monophosphatase
VSDVVDLLPVAAEAVDLASGLLRTHQSGALIAKGDRDMATELDHAIEQQVRLLLRDRTPDIGFLGEEEGAVPATGSYTWVLDPIDGTANFVHGLPLCAVSLGLLDGHRSVLGVIDQPFLGMRYHAVEGSGAYADMTRLQVSSTPRLADAIVALGDYAVGVGAEMKNRDRLAVAARLAAHAQRVRMHGSAAIDLTWLASGRLDATVALSNRTWDMAAGVIIAREAGALVVDKDGSPHTTASTATITAGPALLPHVLDLVREAIGGGFTEPCHPPAAQEEA